MTAPLRVAYLTGMYGRPSDTFIRQEVNQLRQLGLDVRTFSVRRPDLGADPNPDPDVTAHRDATEYLLEAGAARLVGSFVAELATRPLGTLRAVALAWRTRRPGLRGLVKQAVYTVESAHLARRLRTLAIDRLHNHIGENSATVAMLASAMTGKPYSLTIHGPGIFYDPHGWALGEKLRRAAFTACITDYCRSQCQVFGPPECWDRLHVVRCAVPEAFLAEPPTPPPADDPAPLFVCVGRLCAEKAQSLLVEAASRLKSEGRPLRVALVGDGPERDAIERAIDRHGVGGTVEVLGWCSSNQIAELLRGARALVSCSFAEGLPIVLMESYALGRPAIATRVAATYELVEPSATGWLIPPSSIDALADALRAALDTPPETLAAYATEGRRRVEERHHPRRQAERLAELLRDAR